MKVEVVYPGSPCTCAPGRYVRYVIPRGVAGCKPIIACRANNAGTLTRGEHPLPPDVEVLIRIPSIKVGK